MSKLHEITKFQGYIINLKAPILNEEISQIFQYFWNFFITDVNILIKNGDCVELLTFFPFNPGICREISIKTIYNSCFHELPRNYFPEKFNNLSNCSIKAIGWSYVPYLDFSRKSPNEPWNLYFVEGEIVNTFIKSVNAFLEMKPFDRNGKTIPDELVEKSIDLIVGGYYLIQERLEYTSWSFPHIYTWFVMFLSNKGSKISPVKILTLPFSTVVWICWILTCICGIFTFKIINKFNFPKGIFTMISLFLDDPIKLPTKSLHRFNISIWLITSIIFSCTYGSTFFRLLQTDLRDPPPKTFQEIIDTSFSKTIVSNKYVMNAVSNLERIKMADMNFQLIDSDIPIHSVIESKQKVIGVCEEKLYEYGVRSFPGKTQSLSEHFLTFYNTIYFSKNSFILRKFNKYILTMFSFGIMNKWKDIHYKIKPYKISTVKVIRPLTLYELGGIFQIYAVLCLIAIIAYFLENTIFYVKRKKYCKNFVLKNNSFKN